jgi:AraC-like DNA-binding protein
MADPQPEVRYTEYAPPAACAHQLLSTWHFELAPRVQLERPFAVWPDASMSVVLPARGMSPPVISGPRDLPGEVPARPGDETWGVKWWPDCGGDALGVDPTQFVSRFEMAADDIATALLPVRDAIRDGADDTTVREMLELWAETRVGSIRAIDSAVRGAIQALAESRGATAIASVAEVHGVSPRTLTRRFTARVGMPPKVFARICRFRYALHQFEAKPGQRMTTQAARAGYSDESHLFREFRVLTGLAPREVARRLSLVGHGDT